MRCMQSCITGLEQILDWGNRKPVSVVNSEDSNVRASQLSNSATVRLYPPCPTHAEGHAPRKLSFYVLSFIYGRCSDWNFIEVYTVQSFKSVEILAAFPYWYICNRTFQVLPAWLPSKGQENQKINCR